MGPSLLLVLTLLGALVAGVLQRQADGTVVSCAIFPVGDDLSGRRTVSHCRGKEMGRESNRVYNLDADHFALFSHHQVLSARDGQSHEIKVMTVTCILLMINDRTDVFRQFLRLSSFCSLLC